MFNPIISIILPAYNADKYLNKCIESVQCQSYTNWELLIINDGSTDNTEHICEVKSAEDNRIKNITIENGGVSNARNTGLSRINGDFVFFIDADDFLKNDCLEVMINEQKSNDYDIVVSSHLYIYDDSSDIVKSNKIKENEILFDEAIRDTFLLTDKFGWEIWGKLYKKNIVETIRFKKDRKIAEDAVFFYEALCNSKKVSLLKYHGYYYRQNTGSVMAQKISDKNFDTILSVNDIKKLAAENGNQNANSFELKYYIWFIRHYIKGSDSKTDSKYKDEIKEIKKGISKYKLTDAKRMVSKKYFGEYLLIKNAYCIYRFLIRMVY